MIKINTIDDIKNADNSELIEYFTVHTIKNTAKKINIVASKLSYYLRTTRKLNFKNAIIKKRTEEINKISKSQLIKLLQTMNASQLAVKYKVSKSVISKILKKHNINIKLYNINIINQYKKNVSIDRKEFIKRYCIDCYLWTSNKNVSYWNPEFCLKYGCINKNIKYLQNKVNFAYNSDKDTVYYIAKNQNTIKLSGWHIE